MAKPTNGVSEAIAPGLFSDRLHETILRLNQRLPSAQIERLSKAMPRVLWEFPDASARICLAVDPLPLGLRVVASETDPPVQVRMSRDVFEGAAFGTGSLGTAFLTGRLQVRGLNPLKLRDFIGLVDPLLASYRESCHAG